MPWTSLKLFPLMEHPKDDHNNYCLSTCAFWCIFRTLKIVYFLILTLFWKYTFQVGKNEKIKQAKTKVPKFKLTCSYSKFGSMHGFHFLFTIFYGYISSANSSFRYQDNRKTAYCLLYKWCHTSPRSISKELSNAHHWRLLKVEKI